MELSGTIKVILEERSPTPTFKVREFVVTTQEDRYPQQIILQCVNDKTTLLDGVQPGDKVRVHFDIRGRENNGRYFNSLNAWKIDREGVTSTSQSADTGTSTVDQGTSPQPVQPPVAPPVSGETDDLPF